MKDVNLAIFAFYVSAAYPLIRRLLLLIAVRRVSAWQHFV
jgi:hypothetical protein